jgi:hypothetical protein
MSLTLVVIVLVLIALIVLVTMRSKKIRSKKSFCEDDSLDKAIRKFNELQHQALATAKSDANHSD